MNDGLKYYLILHKDKLRASFAGSGQKAALMKNAFVSRGFTIQEVSKDEFLEKRDAV